MNAESELGHLTPDDMRKYVSCKYSMPEAQNIADHIQACGQCRVLFEDIRLEPRSQGASR
jgi:hypothetical protein